MNVTDEAAVVDGVRLAYRDRGDGPAVVFVHGTPAHTVIWREVLPAVESAGYRVIAYDLLGYGASERPVTRDTAVPAQGALLVRLLEHLDVGRVALVGHDIGGAIGQLLPVDTPERLAGLVLIDTVSYDSWPSASWRAIIEHHLDAYAALGQEEFEALLAGQLTMTVADPQRMTGDVLDAYLAPHRSRVGRMSFFEHQVRTYDSAPTRRTATALPSLAVPTRIIWGEQDRWQPVSYAHRLANDILDAQLALIEGAGHFLMEDAPDRVATEVLDFLARGSSSDQRRLPCAGDGDSRST
jgi:pimeloyl-ACP methyl ester carboxylesterase